MGLPTHPRVATKSTLSTTRSSGEGRHLTTGWLALAGLDFQQRQQSRGMHPHASSHWPGRAGAMAHPTAQASAAKELRPAGATDPSVGAFSDRPAKPRRRFELQHEACPTREFRTNGGFKGGRVR